jgi:hypothetical protein
MPKAKPKPPPKKKKAPPPRRPTRVPAPKKIPPKKVHAEPIQKARDIMTGEPTKKSADVKTADEPMSMKERRAQLLQQAEDNEAANDEAYEKQVDANLQFAAKMEKANDPEERDKADAAAAKKANPKYIASPTSPDFKQGQAAG